MAILKKTFIRIATGILFFLPLLSLSISCSKKAKTGKVHLDFQLKNLESLNASHEIMLVSLQVSGGGAAPIEISKFCESDNLCDQFEVDINSGTQRLVQVALLAKDQASGAESVYYGDVLRSLSGSSQIQSLTVKVRHVVAVNEQTRLTGQYIPQATHPLAGKSLTGRVQLRLKPENRPSIHIHQFEIFGGWFETAVFNSVKVQYRFEGWDAQGRKYGPRLIFNDLAGGSLGLDTAASGIAETNNRIYRLELNSPTYYRRENHDGSGNCQSQEPETYNRVYAGFFGAAPGSLCSNGIPTQFRETIYADSSCSTEFTVADLVASDWALPEACGATSEKVYLENVDREVMGIDGPFRYVDGTTNLIEQVTDAVAGTTTLAWNPVDSAKVHRYDIWSLVQENFDWDQVRGQDSTDCDRLAGAGFRLQQSALTSSYNLSGDESANPGALNVAVCVQDFDGKYYSSVLEHRGDQGYNPLPPAAMELKQEFVGVLATTSASMNENICTGFTIHLEDVNGNRTHFPGGVVVNVRSLTNSTLSQQLYETREDCNTGSPKHDSLNGISFEDSFEFFAKWTDFTVTSPKIEIDYVSGAPSPLPHRDLNLTLTDNPLDHLQLWAGNGVGNDFALPNSVSCLEFRVVAMDASARPTINYGNINNFDFGLVSSGAGAANLTPGTRLYNSYDSCFDEAGPGPGSWSNAHTSFEKPIYYRTTGSENTTPFTLAAESSNVTMSAGTTQGQFMVGSATSHTDTRDAHFFSPNQYFEDHYHMDLVGPVGTSLCTPVIVTAYETDPHQPALWKGDETISDFSQDTGETMTLWTDNSCSTTQISLGASLSPTVNTTEFLLYIKFDASTTFTGSFSLKVNGQERAVDIYNP